MISKEFKFPQPYRVGFEFLGWSDVNEISSSVYQADDSPDWNKIEPSSITTFRASWRHEGYVGYTVKNYLFEPGQEPVLLNTVYNPDGGVPESSITIRPVRLQGYVTPEAQTITLGEEGSNIVEFLYTRTSYSIAFDPNGAEYGEMETITGVQGGKSYKLPANTYQKDGYVFTGWGDSPKNPDKFYADESEVLNLAAHGKTATLYAQWAETAPLPHSTFGTYTFKIKAGERIELSGVPHGTTYTVIETAMPDYWTQASATGTSGEIESGTISRALIVNEYHASGSADIVARKRLHDGLLGEGNFQFELLDETQSPSPIIASNEVPGDDGIADIVFPSISYTQPGTYRYTIREVQGSGTEDIIYDTRELAATVTATDAGYGKLDTTVEFEDGDLFENRVKTTSLVVEHSLVEATEISQNSEFSFGLNITKADGSPMTGTVSIDGQEATLDTDGNATIRITGGGTSTISGLPIGSRCHVETSSLPGGWKPIGAASADVTLDDEDNTVSFSSRYYAVGSWQTHAHKTLVGDTLSDGQYSFELLGAGGNVVSSGTNDGNGLVSFTPLTFTNEDHGKTVNYTMVEILGNESGTIYDTHEVGVSLTISDNGDGTMGFEALYDDGNGEPSTSPDEEAVFINRKGTDSTPVMIETVWKRDGDIAPWPDGAEVSVKLVRKSDGSEVETGTLTSSSKSCVFDDIEDADKTGSESLYTAKATTQGADLSSSSVTDLGMLNGTRTFIVTNTLPPITSDEVPAPNITFTVPSSVNFVVSARGDLIGPTNAYMENGSIVPVGVTSLEATEAEGWNIVSDTAASGRVNAVDIEMKPASGTFTHVSRYLNEETPVEHPEEWGMQLSDDEDGSGEDTLGLAFRGKVANLDVDIMESQRFGILQWHVDMR